MASGKTLYIAGFAVVALMVVATFLIVPPEGDEPYGGTDGTGGEIAEDKYGYETWIDGSWMDLVGFTLPGETESLLFALQAAIGAVIIGFFIGTNSARKS